MSSVNMGTVATKFDSATDSPEYRLGSLCEIEELVEGPKEYLYGRAAAVQTVGTVCVEGPNGVWSAITTANTAPGQLGGHGSRVGVVAAAVLGVNQYGWYQVFGQAQLRGAGAIAVGTRLNTTATPGSVDDDGTVGARTILGITLKTALGGAGIAPNARLEYPSVGATL